MIEVLTHCTWHCESAFPAHIAVFPECALVFVLCAEHIQSGMCRGCEDEALWSQPRPDTKAGPAGDAIACHPNKIAGPSPAHVKLATGRRVCVLRNVYTSCGPSLHTLTSLPFHRPGFHCGSSLLETHRPGHQRRETPVETWSARPDLIAEVPLPQGEHPRSCTKSALQLSILVPPESQSARTFSNISLLHWTSTSPRPTLDCLESSRTNTNLLATAQLERWSRPSKG